MQPAVLYTNDMEPVTVVSLPAWAWERLGRGDVIRLEAMEPLRPGALYGADWPRLRVVAIRGEVIVMRGKRSLMLFVDDEESALLLKSEFLPGQRREVCHLRDRARATGFLQGLLAAIDGLPGSEG